MRLPCVSWRRAEGSEMPRPSSSSSSDTPQDDQTAKPLQFHDPGLARLFSDAAHFGRILTSRADLVEDGFAAEDSRTVHDSLNGFSQLVACDLDDNERAVSERLAQLSVSNWARGGPTTLAPRVSPTNRTIALRMMNTKGPRRVAQAMHPGSRTLRIS
jgi:hypothetical protein